MIPMYPRGVVQRYHPLQSVACIAPSPIPSHQDHSSVAQWTITPAAGVEMKQAGIVAVSGSDIAVPCESIHTVLLDSGSLSSHRKRSSKSPGDFVEHLDHLSDGTALYAVALFQFGRFQTGVLLARLPLETSQWRLVKIGDYEIVDVPLPATTDVDWLVL